MSAGPFNCAKQCICLGLPLSKMGKWPHEWAGISETDFYSFLGSEPVINSPVVIV